MKNWYRELKERYADFPAEVQVLNMVSDLNKAKNLASINPDSAKNHLYKAIILLDYIIADPKWRSKLPELLRLREAIGSLLFYQNPFGKIHQVITASLLLEPNAYKAMRH